VIASGPHLIPMNSRTPFITESNGGSAGASSHCCEQASSGHIGLLAAWISAIYQQHMRSNKK
jgi:hypothetical protein